MQSLRGIIRRRGPRPSVLFLVASAVSIAAAAPQAEAFCLAPFALADRWDDASPIAGYAGESRKAPDWRNNGTWNREEFADVNDNGLYDPGEAYVDTNANGAYDSEPYGALVTGYVPLATPENVISPGGDLGLRITLVPAKSPEDESPGHYLALEEDCGALLGAQRPNGADLRAIDSFLHRQIAADPDAVWDPVTQQVVGSRHCISPRLVPLPLYDPRRPLSGSKGTVQITKILYVFLEELVDRHSATIRIATVPALGACALGRESSSAAVGAPPRRITWGVLKASYR